MVLERDIAQFGRALVWGARGRQFKSVYPDVTNPLVEAAALYRAAEENTEKYGDPPTDGSPSAAMLISMHPVLYGALLYQEAVALERGYRTGRIMAAHDVRLGLDSATGNGSVHFDSDVESPPLWILTKAEKLARGDA